jgi:hypothetical protein
VNIHSHLKALKLWNQLGNYQFCYIYKALQLMTRIITMPDIYVETHQIWHLALSDCWLEKITCCSQSLHSQKTLQNQLYSPHLNSNWETMSLWHGVINTLPCYHTHMQWQGHYLNYCSSRLSVIPCSLTSIWHVGYVTSQAFHVVSHVWVYLHVYIKSIYRSG